MRRLSFLVLLVLAAPTFADDWPQWLGPKRDGVWREKGIVKTLPKALPVVWRKPVAEGYAGPAVANGKVFVTDWVRNPDAKAPGSPFNRSDMPGTERAFCLDAKTGDVIWAESYSCPYRVSYAAGPRCTPVVSGDKVYTLGTMGDLYCRDVKNGKAIWSKNFAKDFGAKVPVWGFSAHPILDGDRLICVVGGADDSLVVAFDAATGKEIWRALTTLDSGGHGPGYAPPVIAEVGKTRQVIVWTPEAVNGLDAEGGKLYWSIPFKLKAGLSVPTPRVYGDRLFLTSFYNGPMMLQLAQDKSAARVLWRARESVTERKTEGLHSIMSTPVLKDGHIYGVCSYGQLRCLRIDSGERIWEDLTATNPGGKPAKEERWGNAFLIPHEDRFFLFNEHGELILANLTPDGYAEHGRVKVLEPTNQMVNRPVVWMHPAFANKCMYARNDKEIVCVSLAEK